MSRMPQDPEHLDVDGLPAYVPLEDVDIEGKDIDIKSKEDYTKEAYTSDEDSKEEEYSEEEFHEGDVEICEFDQIELAPESKGLLGDRSKFHAGLQTASRCLSIFVPSFLKPNNGPPKKLHSTAWLDGLRGVAALLVVCHHSSLLWFSWDVHIGWNPGSSDPWLVQFFKLPIIRLVISGSPQVAIFFVVSGFAISYKPLKLARQGNYAEVGTTLFSSVFRRHSRLFLPAAFVTLCCALATQMDAGFYGYDGLPGAAVPIRVPPHANSLWDQLKHWAWTEITFTNPILNGLVQADDPHIAGNPYDANLWTLPIEFSSSLVVFMFLTAFSRVHNRVRLAAAFFVGVYLQWYFLYWAVFLFFGGMLVCDLHFETEELRARYAQRSEEAGGGGDDSTTTVLPVWARVGHQGFLSRIASRFTSGSSTSRGAGRLAGRVVGVAAFLFALHVLSVPAVTLGAHDTFGYVWLTSLVPAHMGDHVLVPVAAIMTVFVLDHATFLQVLFTNAFSQYLGKISFSLYMLHGPMLWSLGLKISHFFLNITGVDSGAAYVLGVFLSACVWWALTIYCSDLTATYVDEPCVRFSKWAYGKLSKKDE